MTDTFGQNYSISLKSACLQLYLENRLARQLDTTGLMIYRLTWRVKTTPRGWSYCQLVASAPRTKGTGCTSWVTPSARDYKDTPGMKTTRPDGRSRIDQLPRQAAQIELSPWATPTATDVNRGVQPPRPHDTGVPMTQQVALIAGWPTPMASNIRAGYIDKLNTYLEKGGQRKLQDFVSMVFGNNKCPFSAKTEKKPGHTS